MTRMYGEISVDEIDGVPVVWSDAPGPFVAGLMFRVGHVDEAFREAGITHLVEHLALFGIAQPGDHANGFVDQTRTMFHTTGTPEDAVDFLGAVTRQLRDLPLERSDAERDVLRAEYASRSGGAVQTLLAWRYGSGPWGHAAADPVALHLLRGPRLQEWARLRMSRADAALFLSGPPPAGLRLHLPEPDAAEGRHPEPAADITSSLLPVLPAWVPGGQDGAAVHTVLPRTPGGGLLEQTLRARLVDELRHRRSAAYSPSVEINAVTATHSILTVVTDLLRERAVEAAPRVLTQLTDLARPVGEDGSLTAEELTRARETTLRHYADPRSVLASVSSLAWSLITDGPLRGHAEQLARLHDTGPEDVARAAAEAAAAALALVPPAAGPATGWAAAPGCLEPMLLGDGVPSYEDPQGTRLVVTPHAVGLRAPDGDWATVSRERTTALLRWPDGRRLLIGHDATRVAVEPMLWHDGPGQVAQIDRTWPAEVVVEMPARDPDDVPRPSVRPQNSAGRAAVPPSPAAQEASRARLQALGVAIMTTFLGTGLAVVVLVWQPHLFAPALSGAVLTGVVSYHRHRDKVPHRSAGGDTTAHVESDDEPRQRQGIQAPQVRSRPPSSTS